VKDSADDRETLETIAIKQVLLALLFIRNSKVIGQPIIARYEPGHEVATDHENFPFAFRQFHHGLDIPDETLEGWRDGGSHVKNWL
jgi:hypothetical protein